MILAAVSHEDPTRRTFVEVNGEGSVRIGRNPALEPESDVVALVIPWPDRIVNRDHSTGRRKGENLIVERQTTSDEKGRSQTNPFYSNAPIKNRVRLDDPLQLGPGDSFVIGAQGRTTFFWLRNTDELDSMLQGDSANGEPIHREMQKSGATVIDYDQVAELDEYSMRLQLKLLQKELPENVLSGWTDEEDLFAKTSDFLQRSLAGQTGVSAAFIALDADNPDLPFQFLHANTSSRADFQPSKTLVRQILESGLGAEQAHVWSSREQYAELSNMSFVGQVDWVVALPLASLEKGASIYRDSHGRPVFVYVETRQASNTSARVFVPFIRLIASLISSLVSSRQRQRVQDQMSAYFSPALRCHLQDGNEEALDITMANCTVLFCDRRASARDAERAKSDEDTLAMLRENQDFVSELTQIIFDHDGVITDFAGDGVLALWGWPEPTSAGEKNHAAAAVAVAEAVANRLSASLMPREGTRKYTAAFRIGISSGRIAVGKTGPEQQMHISCFGNVVNFGARLEGLGKQLHVPVLLSEETTSLIRGEGKFVRELCYIKPVGFDNAYPIFELVLPREQGGSGATLEHIQIYEEALHDFLQREWVKCRNLLDRLPPKMLPHTGSLNKSPTSSPTNHQQIGLARSSA